MPRASRRATLIYDIVSYQGVDRKQPWCATAVPWTLLGGLVLVACTSTTSAADARVTTAPTPSSTDAAPPTSETVSTPPVVPETTLPSTTTTTTEVAPTTTEPAPSTTERKAKRARKSKKTTTTTTPELDVYDASCVVEPEVAVSLDVVAANYLGAEVSGFDLWIENDYPAGGFVAGDLVDVCVGNGVNDVSGEQRTGQSDSGVASAVFNDVIGQQEKLNQLFAGFGIAALEVDGVSGRQTRQRLCAARLALGMPTSLTDMQPGSAEHLNLMAASSLPTPASTAIESERWILIDRTCQIMFLGEGRDTLYVFPTSTGTEGFETRDQNRSAAFRFNPASDNGGWHDSTEYPVGVDNPLNGNMYKPLYFDLGQAIHGANSVPTAPASKGCARLQVPHQIILLEWLGLNDVTASIWRTDEIKVTVNVQGEYIAP